MEEKEFSPYFPGDLIKVSYSASGVKYPTTNTTFYNSKDQYNSPELAEIRSNNIGCSGYRSSVVNSNGDIKFFPCSDSDTYKDIMKQMTTEYSDRIYYDFDERQNIYDVMYSTNDNAYSGYDYKGNVLKKTLSNVLFKDPVKDSILSYFERGFFALIESTKQIKNYFNYTVKKNNRRVF
jgi:hypothetical protein